MSRPDDDVRREVLALLDRNLATGRATLVLRLLTHVMREPRRPGDRDELVRLMQKWSASL